MVGQPLLAHASRDSRPNHQLTYIALGGRQLALGHVLRHLPRPVASQVDDIAADAPALAASDASESFNTAPPASRVSDGAATLRLVPPPFPAAPGVAPAEPAAKAEKRPSGTSARTSGANEMMVEAAASAPHPARVDERRPRSRIIELPGIVVQPIENEGDEGDEGDGGGEGGGSDQRIANGVEAPTDPPPDTLEDASQEPTALLPESDQRTQRAQPARAQDELAPAPQPTEESPAPAPRRRSGKRAAQRPRASDALFPPSDADRSPLTWLARLQQGPLPDAPTSGDEPPARVAGRGGKSFHHATPLAMGSPIPSSVRPKQPSDTAEQPSPLAASSRALLREATGVDPESVRIYRGPAAARGASAQNADALTDGESIALGVGHATDSPETLGLLAHELTHVAQRRAPRFVPPAALAPVRRTAPVANQPRPQPSVAMPATPTSPTSPTSPADEEAQAALVETRVTSTARAQQAVSFTAPVVAPERTVLGARPARPDTRLVWGNLPAPWEPLPDWLTNPGDEMPSAPAPGSSRLSGPGGKASRQSGLSPASGAPPSNGPVPGAQRAERGRALPAAESEASQSPHAHEGPAPEPDLDALAQQVHTILKRRLAAERRRFG